MCRRGCEGTYVLPNQSYGAARDAAGHFPYVLLFFSGNCSSLSSISCLHLGEDAGYNRPHEHQLPKQSRNGTNASPQLYVKTRNFQNGHKIKVNDTELPDNTSCQRQRQRQRQPYTPGPDHTNHTKLQDPSPYRSVDALISRPNLFEVFSFPVSASRLPPMNEKELIWR